MQQGGRPGGHVPPHFLADQLTLSQPGGAHYPHPVLCAPPDFQTLRRPCGMDMKLKLKENFNATLERHLSIVRDRNM